ncbi:hypothetical protein E2C01_061405 [Portunus trituberculatus]|uniref:Uncharacterized protein n=1 Tax=Portunus trituberculatus TaxID=210409 RepID=A0A5B7HCC1_PORTR|nr:hypothetical protein [Portunus trituberculatus]
MTVIYTTTRTIFSTLPRPSVHSTLTALTRSHTKHLYFQSIFFPIEKGYASSLSHTSSHTFAHQTPLHL